ncbi:MAG TPA: AMP-binding protein, partial [Chloroflexota bacterium]|nr:AMP-binding protein [Chloroflexota bacterium]
MIETLTGLLEQAAARAVAEQLGREYQIGRGDRVLVWAPNSPQLVAVYFGCMLAGAILVPLDPFSTPDFIARVAAKTRAAAMVTGAGQVPALSCRVIRLDELRFALPAVREAPALVAPGAAARPGPEDVVEVVLTSGTTGEPKGVVLSHRNVVANVQSVRGVIPEGPPYRLLSLLPLSHMLEQTCGLYLPLLYGATIVYLPSRQPGAVFKALRRWRIMAMVVVPVLLEVMLRGIEREVRRRGQWPAWERLQRIAPYLPMAGRRLLFSGVHRQLGGCLDFFMCGGAHLSPPLAVAWERLGVKVAQGYGTTECAPVVASHTLARRAFDSVGRPVRGVQVRLSEAGEVLVKGPNVTARYWEDEAATRGAFTADGWFRTGDLAELDADGQLRLKGRLKDTIVLPSGLNVYPEDVERELAREAEVAGCVVLGLPDASGVLGVHAAVLPADRSGTPEAVRGRVEAALRRANARLAPHQQAKSCSIWPHDDFPRTSSMKVKRHEVRAILERAGRGTADVAPRSAHPRAVAAEDR